MMTTLPAYTARELFMAIAKLKAICHECQIVQLPTDADPIDRNRLLQAMIFIDRAEQSLSAIAGLSSNAEPGDVSFLIDQPPGIYYTAQTAAGPQTRYYPINANVTNEEQTDSSIQQSNHRL